MKAGKFPDVLKLSKITPVYKKEDEQLAICISKTSAKLRKMKKIHMKSFSKPWITPNVQRLIDKKNKRFRTRG